MKPFRTVWSMVGEWLIYVPDVVDGGQKQLCLPARLKEQAHVLGAAVDLLEALAMSVAEMEAVRARLDDAGMGDLGAGRLGAQCDFNRDVLAKAWGKE